MILHYLSVMLNLNVFVVNSFKFIIDTILPVNRQSIYLVCGAAKVKRTIII